jgi:ribose-phosphate pyrophosphokinase
MKHLYSRFAATSLLLARPRAAALLGFSALSAYAYYTHCKQHPTMPMASLLLRAQQPMPEALESAQDPYTRSRECQALKKAENMVFLSGTSTDAQLTQDVAKYLGLK